MPAPEGLEALHSGLPSKHCVTAKDFKESTRRGHDAGSSDRVVRRVPRLVGASLDGSQHNGSFDLLHT